MITEHANFNSMPEQVQENMGNIKRLDKKYGGLQNKVVFVGAWLKGRKYVPQNIVSYNGSTYICISTVYAVLTPPQDITHFELFVAKGEGAPGKDGADGNGIEEIQSGVPTVNGEYTFTPIRVEMTKLPAQSFEIAAKNGADGAPGKDADLSGFVLTGETSERGIIKYNYAELTLARFYLSFENEVGRLLFISASGSGTAQILGKNVAFAYEWQQVDIGSTVKSLGEHSIDISTALPGWVDGAVYEAVVVIEAYCTETAYMQTYTDIVNNDRSDQRFSTNGRQGGGIYTLPLKRYLKWHIHTNALGVLYINIRAIRRVY